MIMVHSIDGLQSLFTDFSPYWIYWSYDAPRPSVFFHALCTRYTASSTATIFIERQEFINNIIYLSSWSLSFCSNMWAWEFSKSYTRLALSPRGSSLFLPIHTRNKMVLAFKDIFYVARPLLTQRLQRPMPWPLRGSIFRRMAIMTVLRESLWCS